MRHALASCWAVLVIAASLMVVVTPAHATCDGGGACSCGSTVDVHTTLSSLTDPVCSTVCPGTGLFVNSGITLDLGGCTLRGTAGVGNGVQAGAGAQIGGGKITGFVNGVSLTGDLGRVSDVKISGGTGRGIIVAGDENTVEKAVLTAHGLECLRVTGHANLVSHVQTLDCRNEHGIVVIGDDNRVEQSKARRSQRVGIEVVGAGNTVFSSQVEDSPWGIVARGAGNTIERSKVRRSRSFGVLIFGTDSIATANRVEDGSDAFQGQGARNVFSRNVAVGNLECGVGLFFSTDSVVEFNQLRSNVWGLCIEGTGHTVSRNVVSGSVQSGIVTGRFVDPSVGGVFDGNRSTNNGGFGIEEIDGGGNTYTSNICTGNDLGASSPAALCP